MPLKFFRLISYRKIPKNIHRHGFHNFEKDSLAVSLCLEKFGEITCYSIKMIYDSSQIK